MRSSFSCCMLRSPPIKKRLIQINIYLQKRGGWCHKIQRNRKDRCATTEPVSPKLSPWPKWSRWGRSCFAVSIFLLWGNALHPISMIIWPKPLQAFSPRHIFETNNTWWESSASSCGNSFFSIFSCITTLQQTRRKSVTTAIRHW